MPELSLSQVGLFRSELELQMAMLMDQALKERAESFGSMQSEADLGVSSSGCAEMGLLTT